MSEAALTVRRGFARVDAALCARLKGVPSGNLADAQGRRGAISHDIRPVTRAAAFCGPALTVYAGPDDNLAAWAALDLVEAGDVIVIDTHGWAGSSVIGDGFAGMARNAGAVAIVTDGMVRDRAGLDEAGLPVFARGLSPNSPQKHGPGRIGLPLALGGVPVAAGDLVLGDDDGVVVVPRARAGAVAEALAAVEAKERAMAEAVARGDRRPGWLDEALERLGVHEAD